MRLIDPHERQVARAQSQADPAPPEPPESPASAAVARWLAIVARLLRTTPGQRDDIVYELEAHLHERVRDLMISGVDESAAVQQSIAEVGEAAEIARSFNHATQKNRRRRIMNLGLATLGVGAITISAATMFTPDGGGSLDMSVFTETMPQEHIAEALEQSVSVSFEQTPINEVIAMLAKQIDQNVHVHWRDLELHGVSPEDTLITMQVNDVNLGTVMRLLLDELNTDFPVAALHWGPEVVEIGVQEEFDERSSKLVSYDVTSILAHLEYEYDIDYDGAVERIGDLVMQMVETDHWEDMGGRLARHTFVGGRWFVKAPERMHKQIVWILNELNNASGEEHMALGGTPIEPGAGRALRGLRDGWGGPGDPGGPAEPENPFGDTLPELDGPDVVEHESWPESLPPEMDPLDGEPESGTLRFGDLIRIEVFELLAADQMYVSRQRIGPGGQVRLPIAGGVDAAGHSLEHVESTIRRTLAETMVADPIVTVYFEGRRSRFALGAAGVPEEHVTDPLAAEVWREDPAEVDDRPVEDELGGAWRIDESFPPEDGSPTAADCPESETTAADPVRTSQSRSRRTYDNPE